MVNVQYFVGIAVKIGVYNFIIPVKPIGMKVISKSATSCCFLGMSLHVLVCEEVRSPVHSRCESLRTTSELSWIV